MNSISLSGYSILSKNENNAEIDIYTLRSLCTRGIKMYFIFTFITISLIILCIILKHYYKEIFRKKRKKLDVTELNTVIPAKSTSNRKNENPLKAPDKFMIKTFFQTSKAEKIVYEYLLKNLSPHYTIIPHVSLTDLFSSSHNDNEIHEYNIYKLLGYHVDFAIFDKLYHPIMAIELNGSSHWTNPKIIWSDQRKKELFEYFNIPFITVDLSKSYKDEDLKQLVQSKIEEKPHILYCWSCHVPITHPFAECSVCHKTNIHVPPLFKK